MIGFGWIILEAGPILFKQNLQKWSRRMQLYNKRIKVDWCGKQMFEQKQRMYHAVTKKNWIVWRTKWMSGQCTKMLMVDNQHCRTGKDC